MNLDTNYYSSQYTKVLHEETRVISGKNGLTDEDRKALKMRKAETKSLALEILLGNKNKHNYRTTFKPNKSDTRNIMYNNYSATGEYTEITHWHSEITVDNSGPCTTNTSLDATIDVAEYIKRAQEHNDNSIRNAGNEFNSFNASEMVNIFKACNAAINEKYTYLRNEALKHADPKQYIYDKYNNPQSPFYASDLDEHQRKIAYESEREMLKNGRITGVHYGDSLFSGMSIKGQAKDADEKIFNRRMINSQLSNMLQGAGVSIPSNAKFICTVDSTTCKISISDNTGDGVDRSDVIKNIEGVLNKGNNGKELYIHIRNSCSSMERNESSQYDYEGWVKFNYMHNVEESSYGMDGDYNSKFIKWCEKYCNGVYSEKAKKVGFDGFMDMDLQIGLDSNGFYDMHQNINWSDIDDEIISKWYSETEFSVLGDVKNTKFMGKVIV